ncbi:MAG: hypothetical protein MUE53_03800 [Chitinophagales bacterium]|nr:hypothetical protein [Chitinophagales bacterium]
MNNQVVLWVNIILVLSLFGLMGYFLYSIYHNFIEASSFALSYLGILSVYTTYRGLKTYQLYKNQKPI